MSGGTRSVTHAVAKAPAHSGATAADSQSAPLKPHPKLLFALCIVFAVWVGGLVVMYVTTVYPHRHDTGRNAPEIDR